MATTPSILDADTSDWAQPVEQLQQAQQTAAAAGPVDQATPPDPAQQQLAAAQQVAAQGGPVDTSSAPQSGEMLDYQQAQHHSRMQQIADAVGDALGGKSYEVARDDKTGKLVVTPREATPGEKWSRAGLAALKGVAAGYSVPNGPGNLGRALAAGAGAGMQMGADTRNQQVQQADADFNAKQQAQTHSANMALLNQRIHAGAFQAMRDGVEFGDLQADRANGVSKMIQDADGVDLGVHDHVDSLADLAKRNPELVKQHAQGRIYSEPEFDADGKVTGVHNYLIDQAWASRRNSADVGFQDLVPGADPAKDYPVAKNRTIPANSMTNGEVMLAQQAASERLIKAAADRHKSDRDDLNTQSEVALRKAQAAEALAGAADKRADADNKKPGDGTRGTSMEQQAEMMYEGRLAPSQLSKRAKTYNELLPLANAYGMKKYGKPFDAEISESRYKTRQATMKDYADGKPADQIGSFNMFLGHAENLSDTIDQLRNTHSPYLNVPLKELRKGMGDARYAAIQPQIEGVRTERENFLNNNHALQAPQIAGAEDLLNENQSLAQSQAAIKSFAAQAITRVGTINDRHKRVMGMDVPDILNETSKRTIRKLGLDRDAQMALGTAYSPAAAPSATGAPQQAPAAPPPPKVGDIVQGHRFNGGNPADPKSWSAQ